MSQYPNEPWTIHQDPTELRLFGIKARIEYDPGEFFHPWVAREVSEDDARRIIACVNACRSLPTAALERLVEEGKHVHLE